MLGFIYFHTYTVLKKMFAFKKSFGETDKKTEMPCLSKFLVFVAQSITIFYAMCTTESSQELY